MTAVFKLPSTNSDIIESLVKLYSGPEDHYSHRVRFALKIKRIKYEQEDVLSPQDVSEELKLINPLYNETPVPTLVDKRLILYEPNIMLSYIDERFPATPLFPSLAKEKALARMLLWKIETTLITRAQDILKEKNHFKAMEMRNELRNIIVGFSIDYLMEDENNEDGEKMTMRDCVLAPILCRFPLLGINLQNNVAKYKPLLKYMNRIFSHPAFIASCSNEELGLLSI